MFSKRTHWPTVPPEATLPDTVLDLTDANPTKSGFIYSEDTLALLAKKAKYYEPESFGLLCAREAVAAYYASRGAKVSPEDVLIAASTSELYFYLFTLLCDPGDTILAPRPSYPLLPCVADLASVKLAPYPLAYDGTWHIPALKRLPARARGVVAIAPNNPTGNYLKHDELTMLEARSPALIVDEVFIDYPLDPRAAQVKTTAGERACLTFTLSGLSKVALLPQAKIAWCVLSGPKKAREAARRRLELIADTFLSPATGAQAALGDLLMHGRRMRQRVRSRVAMNLVVLDEAVRNSPVTRLCAEGGWCAVLRLPKTRSESDWVRRFLSHGEVKVQPGYFYDLPGCHVVISLLSEPKTFAEAVRRVAALSG